MAEKVFEIVVLENTYLRRIDYAISVTRIWNDAVANLSAASMASENCRHRFNKIDEVGVGIFKISGSYQNCLY